MKFLRPLFKTISAISEPGAAKIAREIYLRPAKVRPMSPDEVSLFNDGERTEYHFRGEQINCWAWGNENAPRVLLVHGWGVGPAFFGPLIKALCEAGFRPIIYMGLAHGSRTLKRTTAMTWVHLYREIHQTFEPIYATIGHSLGAGTLISAAHFGLVADRQVLFSPVTDLVQNTEQFGRHLGFPASVMRLMRELVWHEFEADCESLCTGWESLYDVVIDSPTLVIHDKADPVLDISHAERLVEKWPNVRLIPTEAMGHFRAARTQDYIDQTVNFLSQDNS